MHATDTVPKLSMQAASDMHEVNMRSRAYFGSSKRLTQCDVDGRERLVGAVVVVLSGSLHDNR